MNDVLIEDVLLSVKSKDILSKIDDSVWGNKADAIECVHWYIPSDTYEYSELRDKLINGIREVCLISDDIPLEIEYFYSNILSFATGIYPNYAFAEKHNRI